MEDKMKKFKKHEIILEAISEKKVSDFSDEKKLENFIREQIQNSGIKLQDGKKVKIRKPKVRDMRIMGQYESPEDKEINLLANLTGLTIAEIDDLYMEDYGLFQMGLAYLKLQTSMKS